MQKPYESGSKIIKEQKSAENRQNFVLGQFGRSGPPRGRSGTRPESPWDAHLDFLGRHVGRLGRHVGGSGRQVGRLEQRVGPLGSLQGARRARCQPEPFSEQRSKRFFSQCWDDRKKPKA